MSGILGIKMRILKDLIFLVEAGKQPSSEVEREEPHTPTKHFIPFEHFT